MFEIYREKVGLLVKLLPLVSQENCFALHGGTAINLFVRDMPRLSVDIDLTYLPIEDRATTLRKINEALERIKNRIGRTMPNSRVIHREDAGKLLVYLNRSEIKIEVNLVGRGTMSAPVILPVCNRVQSEFEVFATMPVVPLGQLYGGKICAALDRQHPRDLFDVKYLLENEGFSDDVRKGFLLCLLGSDRPIHEVLDPNFLNQRQALENQFAGMSDETFTYDDFEDTRENLVQTIKSGLTDTDKIFLLSVKNCEPDWSLHDFECFPSVQWKLQNLKNLEITNPEKHQELYKELKKKLLET